MVARHVADPQENTRADWLFGPESFASGDHATEETTEFPLLRSAQTPRPPAAPESGLGDGAAFGSPAPPNRPTDPEMPTTSFAAPTIPQEYQPPPHAAPPGQGPPGQGPPGQGPPGQPPHQGAAEAARAARANWRIPTVVLAVIAAAVIALVVARTLGRADHHATAAERSTTATPSRHASGTAGAAGSGAHSPSSSAAAPGAAVTPGPYRLALQVAPRVDGCVATATGQVQRYLAAHGCTTLNRSLYTAVTGGQRVLVSVADVRLTHPADRPAFQTLIASDGTGDIDTLVDSGYGTAGDPRAFSGDPTFLATAGSNSGQLLVLEGMWLGARTTHDHDPALAGVLSALGAQLR